MRHDIKTLKTFFQIASGKKLFVAQKFFACIMYNIAELLPPIAAAGIIAVVAENNIDGIWYYVVLYFIFYIIYLAMYAWHQRIYTILAGYYHYEVQQMLFEHIANNDTIFDKISQGKIMDTCTDDVRYLVDVVDAASWILADAIQLIIIFIIFAYNNIFIAVIALAIDLTYIILMDYNSHMVARYYEGTRKHEDKIADTLNQMLGQLHQVKSFNLMPSLKKKLNSTYSKWNQQYSKRRFHMTIRNSGMPMIVYTGKILMYVFLAYLVVNGKMTIDTLVLLISYFEMVIDVSDDMLEFVLNLSNYGVRVNRIKTILDYQQDNIDYGNLENDYILGSVEFSHVYADINKHKVLQNVSFKAYPNEITAIVGHPGSGKTTVINLLYRLMRVKSGSILIDDESIYNYSEKVYSNNVSGVFQKPFSFKMSIAENLALVDANRNNQIEACKRIGIHQEIAALPRGYNTILDSEHPVLTDGQIQKLSIARAILTGAEILLFDEVTSNIDPVATKDIIDILKDLKDDHTIIITTHNPELMHIADRVVVLNKGKVSAKGVNKEVLKRSNLYKELITAHFTGPSVIE